MGILYLFQFTVEYRGLSQPELFRVWAKEAELVMKSAQGGRSALKQIWKVVGERKVNAVMEVSSPDQADALSIDLPIMKDLGDQVQIEVTPLISYESLAKDLDQNLRIDPAVTGVDSESAEGMYYWLHFKMHQDGMTQEDLFKLLTEEAVSAMGKIKIVDVWKCVAKNEIHSVFRVSSPEDVDKWLCSEQPMLKKMGDKVTIDCKSLRSYRGFYEDLKRRLSSSDDSSK